MPNLDEPDLQMYVRHFRRVDCPPLKSEYIPMISQLPSGEIMIGVPHRSKSRAQIKCMGRELTGTLRKDKRKVVEVGDWFEVCRYRIFEFKCLHRSLTADDFSSTKISSLLNAQTKQEMVNLKPA